MFLIRRRDQRGSEDRSCAIDNGCFELVERCRYVTEGMEFDLTPLPSTADVSFVYNTPMPFVMSLTSTLEEVERQKSLVVDAHELLRARTEMFLPLIFSVRHVVGQYREVRGSEPTVHDILKNIREGLAWIRTRPLRLWTC